MLTIMLSFFFPFTMEATTLHYRHDARSVPCHEVAGGPAAQQRKTGLPLSQPPKVETN